MHGKVWHKIAGVETPRTVLDIEVDQSGSVRVFIRNIVRKNNPVFSHHHPQYHPLEKVDNQAILDCSNRVSTRAKDYFNPENDFSVKDKINP